MIRPRALAAILVSATVAVAAAPTTSIETISVTSTGAVGDGSSQSPDVSSDGRFVVFESVATDLVAGGTSQHQIFLRDRQTQTTELVSQSTGGAAGDGLSFSPRISADGRFVVFESVATNLVAGDGNGKRDVFLRDRMLATTERVSVSSSGGDADDDSYSATVSDDGRFVAFASDATNLAPGGPTGVTDVLVRDRQAGTTERISRAVTGNPDGLSLEPCISGNGRFVAFTSGASNLLANDKNGIRDVFVFDRVTQRTELVSVASKGKQGNGESSAPRISPDGRFVVFESLATNLGGKVPQGATGVFLRDRALGSTEWINVSVAPKLPTTTANSPAVSGDGRFVVFEGQGLALAQPESGVLAIYVRDRQSKSTARVSATAAGAGLDAFANSPSISRDGLTAVFDSASTQLATNDANGAPDVFASTTTWPASVQTPVADAGTDQTVPPTGAKTKVSLDASGSSDPGGSALKFVWYENGKKIAAGVHPTVKFATGIHAVTLVATDKKKLVGVDYVTVTVAQ